jgi:polyisoprenoid-binding protein YceI
METPMHTQATTPRTPHAWLAIAAPLLLLAACSKPANSETATTPPAAATAAAAPAQVAPKTGSWQLQTDASRLSFVSIKNNAVAEVHRFAEFSGSMDAEGQASLQIALGSVQTGIELRDQRLRDMLFETGTFPTATVTVALDPQPITALAPGASLMLGAEARLELHGVSNRLPAMLRVTRLDADTLLVTSEQPVIVNATNFGLINGIDQLRQAAGLQAIGSGVPVSFALVFKQS